MLVLGLTSGLSSVGYSVLSTTPSHLQQIECDLLAGSRSSDSPTWRRCNAHRLVLSIVLERYPPAVIALGPPVEPDEPVEFVMGMRELMRSIAMLIRVPVIEFPDELGVVTALDFVSGKERQKRRLNKLVSHHLGAQCPSNRRINQRIILATGTALAAALTMNRQRSTSSSAPL